MNTILIHHVDSTRVTRKVFSIADGHSSEFDVLDIDIKADGGFELQISLFVKSGQILDGISETPAALVQLPYTSDEPTGFEAAFVEAAASAHCQL